MWFEKAHTCLYKVPQLTVHVRAKTNPWGWRKCPLSSETGLCRGTDLGKGTKIFVQHWRSPRTQWPPSFLIWRSLEPLRLFLELAARPIWAIEGEGPSSGRWPRILMVTLTELREMGDPSRWTTISAAIDQSDLYGRVARQKPLLCKRNMTARLEFAKRHLKDSQTMRNKIL